MGPESAKLPKPVVAATAGKSKSSKASPADGATPPIANDGKPVTEVAIRFVAFQKWEAAGKPNGDGVDFWLDAERELLARSVS